MIAKVDRFCTKVTSWKTDDDHVYVSEYQTKVLKECSGHALPTITDTQERIYKPFQTFWRRRKWAIIIYAAVLFCSSDFCWKFACVQKCAKNHERMSLVPRSKNFYSGYCNSQNITTNCCICSSIIQMFVLLAFNPLLPIYSSKITCW